MLSCSTAVWTDNQVLIFNRFSIAIGKVFFSVVDLVDPVVSFCKVFILKLKFYKLDVTNEGINFVTHASNLRSSVASNCEQFCGIALFAYNQSTFLFPWFNLVKHCKCDKSVKQYYILKIVSFKSIILKHKNHCLFLLINNNFHNTIFYFFFQKYVYLRL